MKKTLTIFFLLLSFPHYAQAENQARGEHVSARLISGFEGVGKRDSVDMGLELSLQKDWYTYWRLAGDSGLPPTFDWSGSTNVKEVKVDWPAPERFTAYDLHSFGYQGDVILPLTVIPLEAGKDMDVHLKVDMVVCHEICIPESLTLSKNLHWNDAIRSPEYDTLKKARENLPSKINTQRLGMETAVLGQNAIVVTAYTKGGFQNTDMIVEAPDVLITTPPEILQDTEDHDRAVIKITGPEGFDLAKALFGKTATITLINGHEAVERQFAF